METALYTGVTGLLAHQRRLNVIANNIANVNTTGYRGSRALFQDLFYQTLQSGHAPTASSAGRNAMQVGLGVRVGAIDIDLSQASLLTTGVNSDLAIQGSGFFVLSDGTGVLFSRDGSFQLNSNNELIDPATGLYVQGFMADADGNVDSTSGVTNIAIPIGGDKIVNATTSALMEGNLDSQAAVGATVVRTLQVYDSLGTEREVTITFTKTANTNEWTWEATSADATTNPVGQGTLQFDNEGNLTSPTEPLPISVTFAAGDPQEPINPLDFTVDVSTVTQLADPSDMFMRSQNGFPPATLTGFTFSADGIIHGVYTNGQQRVLGQVALATFTNPGGIERVGNNMFRETTSSGVAQVGAPTTGARGSVLAEVLEGSNVDLGTEFTNMVITQRGFQANARTITTADTMLQETINLIR